MRISVQARSGYTRTEHPERSFFKSCTVPTRRATATPKCYMTGVHEPCDEPPLALNEGETRSDNFTYTYVTSDQFVMRVEIFEYSDGKGSNIYCNLSTSFQLIYS